MSRQREFNAGSGVGRPTGGPNPQIIDTQEESVQATAPSDYGNLAWLKTGNYFDSYEWDISPTTDTFVAASVPPGNSYNDEHYATDDGLGADYSEASSELPAAMIRLEGQMQRDIECDFTWYKPDGSVFWEGSVTVDAPTGCGYEYCWTEYIYFYTFTGRDFSHGANQEISQRGTYTVEFDTNYGTYSETIEVIGPQLTTCDTPNSIQQGGSAEFGATIEKPIDDDNSYNGDVVVAREMTDSYTTRDVIHREPFYISGFQDSKRVSFDVPASAFDQFGGPGSDTPIMMWAETYGF